MLLWFQPLVYTKRIGSPACSRARTVALRLAALAPLPSTSNLLVLAQLASVSALQAASAGCRPALFRPLRAAVLSTPTTLTLKSFAVAAPGSPFTSHSTARFSSGAWAALVPLNWVSTLVP